MIQFSFHNQSSIVKRRIYSEKKAREKIDYECKSSNKIDLNLDKIEILTFANKFPGLRKRSERELDLLQEQEYPYN